MQVLVTTRTANYTTGDLHTLLHDAHLHQQAAVYADVQRLTGMLLPLPDVRVYSLFGVHIDTPMAFHYDTTNLGGPGVPSPSVTAWGDGDGVVPLGSLAGCVRYTARAVPLPLPEASHWGILRLPRAVQIVTTVAGFADVV